MKSLLFGTVLLISVTLTYSQAPQAFNYQAILRNSDGTIKTGEPVSLQVSIVNDKGASVYLETHDATTNEFGLVNVIIGQGSSSDDFSMIDWGNGPYYLELEIDDEIIGSSQLISVPYALHASSVDREYIYEILDSLGLLNPKIEVTDFDGNIYGTVQIGDQVWMAENLRSTHYSDGTSISGVSVYDNNEDNAAIYGRLYTWEAMMNGAASSDANPSGIQGVCPSGWHLPSDNEWKELEMNLGMDENEANAADARGTNEGSKLAGNADLWNNGALENDSEFGTSGFMALPGGFRGTSGNHIRMADYAYFWSATVKSGVDTWIRVLIYDKTQVYRGLQQNQGVGFSVRCVKD